MSVKSPNFQIRNNTSTICLSKTNPNALPKDFKWVYEDDFAGEQHLYEIKKVLAVGETKFQSYSIFDTVSYGLMLFLDGYTQSAQQDEYIYHECLVQPAMLAHPDPKKVLVIGAGEGATGREILYHPNVERLVLIDLDEELIEVCRKHLEPIHRGSFSHPKVELRFEDGYKYLKECKEQFDIIILDVVDAIEEGPAQKLYTREFYKYLKNNCLTKNGIVAVQSMEQSETDFHDDWHVYRELYHSFNHVCTYNTYIPSFWSRWRFTLASDTINLNRITAEQIDHAIKNRGLENKLFYLDGETFTSIRTLSKLAKNSLRSALNESSEEDQEADISEHFLDWDLDLHQKMMLAKNITD